MSKTDEELIIAYQAGAESAFEELYRRYSNRVYGYVKKRVRNDAQADEVFQAIFMKLHRSRGQYDKKYLFAPWLFVICKSVLIDAARAKQIFQEGRFEPWDENRGSSEEAAEVEVDLGELSEPQREVLRLRYQEDLAFEEIAERLELSAPAVRKRVSRAVKALRETVLGKKH